MPWQRLVTRGSPPELDVLWPFFWYVCVLLLFVVLCACATAQKMISLNSWVSIVRFPVNTCLLTFEWALSDARPVLLTCMDQGYVFACVFVGQKRTTTKRKTGVSLSDGIPVSLDLKNWHFLPRNEAKSFLSEWLKIISMSAKYTKWHKWKKIICLSIQCKKTGDHVHWIAVSSHRELFFWAKNAGKKSRQCKMLNLGAGSWLLSATW